MYYYNTIIIIFISLPYLILHMRLAIRLRSTFSNLNNKQIKLTLD